MRCLVSDIKEKDIREVKLLYYKKEIRYYLNRISIILVVSQLCLDSFQLSLNHIPCYLYYELLCTLNGLSRGFTFIRTHSCYGLDSGY